MARDKIRLVIMAALLVALFATVILFAYTEIAANAEGRFTAGDTLAFFIPLFIIFLMTFFIIRRWRDVKQGLPMEDERSRKVMLHASARTFQISLYWLLAISFFESFFAKMFQVEKLDASMTVGGGIAGMAVIFFICWVYYNKKGNLI